MDVTTSVPDVQQESVADLALKTYTLYFLVTAIVLGILFFAAIRKASKVCCFNCMYGSKYTQDQKEDPRLPPTLFRTPSILATLQDHYDKNKSSIRSKSDTTSYGYARAGDIELSDVNKDRVHRYLDSIEHVTEKDKKEEVKESPDMSTIDDHNGLSNYGSMPPSEADTSHKHDAGESVVPQEQEENCEKYSSMDFTITPSQGSLRSTTSDNIPLVSMDPAGDSKRGRFKKNTNLLPPAGPSSRTASAKSTKRKQSVTDEY